MLVPATQSTGTRISSSISITPRCAPPRAPPPPSTRPTFGRGVSARTVADARSMANAAERLWIRDARRCTGYSRLLVTRRLDLQREGREAGITIIVILALGALEEPDHGVRHGREDDFHADLRDELGQHHLRQRLVRDDAG